jgi:hypothetical protein
MLCLLLMMFAKQQKLPSASRAPPCNTKIGAIDVHFAATQNVPKSFDAGGADILWFFNGAIDEACSQREEFLEVFDAEEREGVDYGEDNA